MTPFCALPRPWGALPCTCNGIAPQLRRLSTTISTHILETHNWCPTPAKFVTNALRHAAVSLENTTGIAPKLVSARSLRPGGATALLCANVGSDAIMLLGRWKSDAMLRCLRIQASTSAHSQRMLDHGAHTFAPSSCAAGNLPDQAPAAAAALLQHDELCE